MNPEERGPSTLKAPSESGSAVLDNILAAIAETVSDDLSVPAPSWTSHVRALEQEWVPLGTSRTIARARAQTPERFAVGTWWFLGTVFGERRAPVVSEPALFDRETILECLDEVGELLGAAGPEHVVVLPLRTWRLLRLQLKPPG